MHSPERKRFCLACFLKKHFVAINVFILSKLRGNFPSIISSSLFCFGFFFFCLQVYFDRNPWKIKKNELKQVKKKATGQQRIEHL